MAEWNYWIEDVERLATQKRFSVKKDESNSGYCHVWRKREVLKTEGGADMLTFEEAIELLNEWPDVNEKLKLVIPKFENLKNLGTKKLFNVVFHRPGGIEIEFYGGEKVKNPATGIPKFTYQEAAEWLYQYRRK
jgi:hypothetical protein